MRVLDKLICLFCSLPPLYMLYRFVRWYMRSDSETIDETQASESVS